MAKRKPRWLDERQKHLWASYRHMNQHFYATLEDRMERESGLSGADYAVLVPLSEDPAGLLRARELGNEIGWDRSRLSHHLTRMERRGLIAREECEADARGLMVRITPAGRTAIETAAPDHADAVQRCFFDLLSEDELETLTTVFDRILDNLQQEDT